MKGKQSFWLQELPTSGWAFLAKRSLPAKVFLLRHLRCRFFTDLDVVVIGGGDSGLQEGLYLTKYCNSVTIVEMLPSLGLQKYFKNELRTTLR